jgi:hypothetical protein
LQASLTQNLAAFKSINETLFQNGLVFLVYSIVYLYSWGLKLRQPLGTTLE